MRLGRPELMLLFALTGGFSFVVSLFLGHQEPLSVAREANPNSINRTALQKIIDTKDAVTESDSWVYMQSFFDSMKNGVKENQDVLQNAQIADENSLQLSEDMQNLLKGNTDLKE